ncbi:ribosomal RNA small subunit methyltransferase F [Escherichia coli]|uniref:Ribosomal RNA small subunit methyltransferase F n=1 Tax=Escherichia coli TaxID=562 RepID=A0A377D4Z2_ECOLX|nr:ribosomal RNA small subunit methyltransferase F [Escherichia coli]
MPFCWTLPAPAKAWCVKDPDALKNWSPESNQEIAATQRELIDSAFHALRPGGTLVYSTCTLNQEENEAVCLWLKETYPDAVEFLPLGDLFPGANKALTEEGFLNVFPQIYDCEGFFVARLRKTQAIPALPAPKYKVGNFPFSPVKRSRSRSNSSGGCKCWLKLG